MIAMINDARLAVGKPPVGEFRGLSTKLHESKRPCFDPQALLIQQFISLSLRMHSMTSPLGKTLAAVCVLSLG
jgi:hypothetical protein